MAPERPFEAHRRGEVLAAAGRASDYCGPGGTPTRLGAIVRHRVKDMHVCLYLMNGVTP